VVVEERKNHMKKRNTDIRNLSGDIVTAILYDDIPVEGSTLEDHLHIEIHTEKYRDQLRFGYYLNIGNCEYQSRDLAMLECLLREFAESDGRPRASLPEDMATSYALNDSGNPARIEIVEGGGRIRVEQTFYAIDDQGDTIDGPFDNKQDAIDATKEAKENR